VQADAEVVRALPAQLAHQHDFMPVIAAEAAVLFRQRQAQQPGVARRVPQFARYRGLSDPLLELLLRRVLVDPFGDGVGEEDDLLLAHEIGVGAA